MEENTLKFLKSMTFFMIAVLILSACGRASYKEESKASVETAKTTLHEKADQPNKKIDNINFFLPSGYEIKEKKPNNIILKNGSTTYILFVNPQETASSDVVYQSTVDQYEKLDTNEKFTDQEKLGFLTIKQFKDDKLNEITVGVGGAKITTQAKTANLETEAKVMMQIVNSVNYNK